MMLDSLEREYEAFGRSFSAAMALSITQIALTSILLIGFPFLLWKIKGKRFFAEKGLLICALNSIFIYFTSEIASVLVNFRFIDPKSAAIYFIINYLLFVPSKKEIV